MTLLHPESDLSLSLLAQGADIIRSLNTFRRPMIVDHLLERHLRADRRRTPANFFSALEMLYSIGAIEREGYRVRLLQDTEEKIGDTYDLFGGQDA